MKQHIGHFYKQAMPMTSIPFWHDGEFFNSVTHEFGAVLALYGIFLLQQSGNKSYNNYKLVGSIIYGLTMVALHSSSVLCFHSLNRNSCTIFINCAEKQRRTCYFHNYKMFMSLWRRSIKLFFFDLIKPYSIYIFITMRLTSLFIVKPILTKMHKEGLF